MYCIIKVKKTLLKRNKRILELLLKKQKQCLFESVSSSPDFLPPTQETCQEEKLQKKDIFYYIPNIFITVQIFLMHSKYFI